ncbi:hypothetical protein [Actinophytocola sediminis]
MPEPVLVSIAAALASKGAGALYELVKRKFQGKDTAETALNAAQGAEPDSPEVEALSEQLAAVERSDPEFAAEIRERWQETVTKAESGGVVNQISGNVTGKIVQARDIQGGVRF